MKRRDDSMLDDLMDASIEITLWQLAIECLFTVLGSLLDG